MMEPWTLYEIHFEVVDSTRGYPPGTPRIHGRDPEHAVERWLERSKPSTWPYNVTRLHARPVA